MTFSPKNTLLSAAAALLMLPLCAQSPRKVTAADIAIHTSYAPTASGLHAWGGPLYGLVMSAGATPTSTVGLTADGSSTAATR